MDFIKDLKNGREDSGLVQFSFPNCLGSKASAQKEKQTAGLA